MSNWILYDDFVDLVRTRHQQGFSGLITGVSGSRHSFQLGFARGRIVLLSYRIRKGREALELITGIERAKIIEHPNIEIRPASGDMPDTGTVLSQLVANTLDQTGTNTTDISDLSVPRARPLDARLRRAIESAAVHHFGQIGAMVCREHLSASSDDLRKLVLDIAAEVGASEADTRAFFQTVSSA